MRILRAIAAILVGVVAAIAVGSIAKAIGVAQNPMPAELQTAEHLDREALRAWIETLSLQAKLLILTGAAAGALVGGLVGQLIFRSNFPQVALSIGAILAGLELMNYFLAVPAPLWLVVASVIASLCLAVLGGRLVRARS